MTEASTSLAELAETLAPRKRRKPRPGKWAEDTVNAFWERVDKEGPMIAARPDLGPCWLWTGPKTAQGYGVFNYKSKYMGVAHRYSYRLWVGPIRLPYLDHLCHSWSTLTCDGGNGDLHRSCVAPVHLEPVTSAENNRRRGSSRSKARATNPYVPAAQRPHQTGAMYRYCINGHEWSSVTTMYDTSGKRVCGDCLEGLY